jgi:cathepsin C
MIGKSFAEINQRAGRKRFYQGTRFPKSSAFVQEDYKHYSIDDISDLPTSFDWRDKIAPPRQQGECGSCYTISTMEMLSARLKIKGENVDLSP